MNKYKRNEHDWQIDNVVIHLADAKEERMLMRVADKKNGMYGLRYINPKLPKTLYWNDRKWLLDPKDFGLEVKNG